MGTAQYPGGRPKDISKLSVEPRQVRNRLRRAGATMDRITEDMEILYRKPLSDWDDEELARGRPRNGKGQFNGPVPRWVTPVIQQEAKRRLVEQTFGKMSAHIDSAIKVVVNLMLSTEVDDKGKPIVDAATQLKAAMWILENVMGKPKALVELSTPEDITRQAIASAIVLDDGKPQGHLTTIEGELVDDEEEDFDDDNGE